jgi:hypothetical protein
MEHIDRRFDDIPKVLPKYIKVSIIMPIKILINTKAMFEK